MLEWTELYTLAGPGGPVWEAEARAEDGSRLLCQVWAPERPGKPAGRILTAVRSELRAASSSPEQPRFMLSVWGRPATTSELLEAVHEACQGSPEWWAAMLPWRSDLEPPEGPVEAYTLSGYLFGPVPPGAGFTLSLGVGAQPAGVNA